MSRANSLAESGASRQQVIDALGEPWIGSVERRVDVFLQTGKQRRMGWLLPLPIPVPLPSSQLAGYTLVSYDAEGNVDAVDAAIFSNDEVSSAVLQAGDHALWARAYERDFVVLAVTRERFLRDRASADQDTDCTLLIGTAASPPTSPFERPASCVLDRMRIDGGPDREMDLFPPSPLVEMLTGRPAPVICGAGKPCVWLRLLNPVVLGHGSHTLRFGSTFFDGGIRSEFSCKENETAYMALDCDLTESGEIAGSAVSSPDVPEDLSSHFVLVNRGGRWLVDED